MTAYVTLVAIGNVFLGMVLARIVPPSTLFPRRFAPPPLVVRKPPEPRPEPAEQLVEVAETPIAVAAPVEIADQRLPATTTNPDEVVETTKKASGSAPAAVKTWDDFAQYLRDVKDRTHYCRTAQDMRLARQAAEKLWVCAQVWSVQFERCLLGEQLDEATQALVAGAEMGDIKKFAAQIETTLTNIDALDWTGKVDDVLDCLEREMDLLDKQQKSVVSSGKRTGEQRKS